MKGTLSLSLALYMMVVLLLGQAVDLVAAFDPWNPAGACDPFAAQTGLPALSRAVPPVIASPSTRLPYSPWPKQSDPPDVSFPRLGTGPVLPDPNARLWGAALITQGAPFPTHVPSGTELFQQRHVTGLPLGLPIGASTRPRMNPVILGSSPVCADHSSLRWTLSPQQFAPGYGVTVR